MNESNVGGRRRKRHVWCQRRPQDLAESIFDLLRRLEQPARLADIVPKEPFEAKFRELVSKAQKDLCAITNPVTPTPQEWDDLFRRAYSGI